MQYLPRTSFALLKEVYQKLFPVIDTELAFWRTKAEQIPDKELRKQALASIASKKFHCQGGGVFAILAGSHYKKALRFIVAYQTVSDYLDNLCDRSTSLDPDDFRQLHEAMKDALSPGESLKNYYACRKEQNDGGYLNELVLTCQTILTEMNGYSIMKEKMLNLEALYAELQIHKHVNQAERLPRLMNWYKKNTNIALGLSWNEFAAASGSTLGIFCLASYALGGKMRPKLAEQIVKGYFPYVQGLHILLDYYIDQEEDKREGDLNFCHYYRDEVQLLERMSYFLIRAEEYLSMLPDEQFHRFIPKGLVALYLSDQKVKSINGSERIKKELLNQSGLTGKFLHYNIRAYDKLNNKNSVLN